MTHARDAHVPLEYAKYNTFQCSSYATMARTSRREGSWYKGRDFTDVRVINQQSNHINPRPAGGGGGVWTPPSGFSRIAKKSGAQRRRVFTHLTPHLFRNFCENLDPMPCEVRSPGQVKWPNYKITFQSRHGYNLSGKVMKLSEYDEVTSAYKTYISDFLYRWPKVRSFLRPPHYKSMGKKSTLLYLLWRKPIWVESYRIGQLWTI